MRFKTSFKGLLGILLTFAWMGSGAALQRAWASALSAEPSSEFVKSNWEWARFRLSQYSLFQDSGGFNSVYSGSIAWTPELYLNPHWSLIGLIEGAPVRAARTDQLFPVADVGLLVSFREGLLQWDVGPGAQFWFHSTSTIPAWMLGSAMQIHFSKSLAGVVRGFFVGYSYLFHSPVGHETKVGALLEF